MPILLLLKARRGDLKPGHKYRSRWRDPQTDRWVYDYGDLHNQQLDMFSAGGGDRPREPEHLAPAPVSTAVSAETATPQPAPKLVVPASPAPPAQPPDSSTDAANFIIVMPKVKLTRALAKKTAEEHHGDGSFKRFLPINDHEGWALVNESESGGDPLDKWAYIACFDSADLAELRAAAEGRAPRDLPDMSESDVVGAVYSGVLGALQAGKPIRTGNRLRITTYSDPASFRLTHGGTGIGVYEGRRARLLSLTGDEVDQLAAQVGVPGLMQWRSARSERDYKLDQARLAAGTLDADDPRMVVKRAIDASPGDPAGAILAVLPNLGGDTEYTDREQAIHDALRGALPDFWDIEAQARERATGKADPWIAQMKAAEQAREAKRAADSAAGIVKWHSGVGHTSEGLPVVRDADEGAKARALHDGLGSGVVSIILRAQRDPSTAVERLADARMYDARRAALRSAAAAVGVEIAPARSAESQFMAMIARDVEPRYPGFTAEMLTRTPESPKEIREPPANKYDLAAQLALAQLDDNEWHRLTAAQQRAIFGYAPFGRQSIRVDPANQGVLWVGRSDSYGTDWATTQFSFADVASAVAERRMLRV